MTTEEIYYVEIHMEVLGNTTLWVPVKVKYARDAVATVQQMGFTTTGNVRLSGELA